MKRSILETVLGGIVLLAAFSFLIFGYQKADVRAVQGYEVTADFVDIGGLKPGDDVRISGIKVGTIKSLELTPDTYMARLHLSIEPQVKLATDSSASVTSESLLGGRYLAVEPGNDDENLQAGGRIVHTQSAQNLEQLLGKFVFNASSEPSSSPTPPGANMAPEEFPVP